MKAPVMTFPRQAALDYAAHGWAIVPLWWPREGRCACGKNDCNPAKHPLFNENDLAHGWNSATTDVELINRWWARWPHANVGIATGAVSGVMVLDVDPRNGGEASLIEAIGKFGPLAATPTVRTGGDGKHFYLAYDGRPSIKGFMPGLDLLLRQGRRCGTLQRARLRAALRLGGATVVALAAPPQWIPVAPPTNGHSNNGRLTPASADTQAEFQRLMARAGVQPRRGGQELVRCPWHKDTRASLSVNWPAAVFNCQGACGEKGSLRRLRELVGEPVRERIRPLSPPPKVVPIKTTIDPERERLRLASAMKAAGLSEFDRATGRALYETVIECHRAFSKYECPNDGRRKVLASSCGFRLCPSCLPTRLRADFKRHRASLPDRVDLFVWKPESDANAPLSRREVSDAFKRWRRERGLLGGFYGLRFNVRNETLDVLLVLPVETSKLLDISPVTADVDIDTAIDWYVGLFLEEATSWRTPDEMLDLLAAVKGCRRFQGFGEHYQRSENVSDKHLSSDTPTKLGKVAGGSSKGGGREPVLCECGARMRFIGMALTKEEADAWVQGGTSKAIGLQVFTWGCEEVRSVGRDNAESVVERRLMPNTRKSRVEAELSVLTGAEPAEGASATNTKPLRQV